MNFLCVLSHWALKTNPCVLWARSVGLSVEFSWLLSAQAGGHQKSIKTLYISPQRKENTQKKGSMFLWDCR